MAFINKSNQRPVENFLVAKSTTTLPTSGTLYNTTTGVVNLADGQLGVVSDSIYGSVAMNSFVDGTPTAAEAPVIKIYQGTEYSASPATASTTYPLWPRVYEASNSINGAAGVTVTYQAYRAPSFSTWVVGKAAGDAAEINADSETEYGMTIAFRGRRVSEMYGREEAASFSANYTTPDFTATGLNLSEPQARMHLLTNLGWNINRNSSAFSLNSRYPANVPVIAFLIASAGGAGVAIGGVDPIIDGDTVTVVTTTAGNKTFTFTEGMADSIKNAALAVQGGLIADLDWTIIPINLATQNVATPAAGDILMIMGLDDKLSFVDYIPQVKNRLQIGLTRGFNYPVVYNDELVKADEGQGKGRVLDLLYKATQGQRKYNLRHVEDPIVNFPSPVVTTEKYNVFNILHGSTNTPDIASLTSSPYREIVCVPTSNATLVTNFTNFMNAWLPLTGNEVVLTQI